MAARFFTTFAAMIFPANFEQKLGFDVIRRNLAEHCLSPLGRDRVGKIAFSADPEDVRKLNVQTAEMKQILEFEERFPSQDYYDLVPELLRIRVPGSYAEPETLSELRLSVLTIAGLLEFITSRREKYPSLMALAQDYPGYDGETALTGQVPLLRTLAGRIDRIIDDKSDVRDSASPELGRIRHEKVTLTASVERKILQSFRLARQNGWTPDDAEVTVRNGRLVIPLVNTHKRKIQGFLHDESATGHTVYVEPAEIFETNNEIRELEYAERREIVKILTTFADILRPETGFLVHAYGFLGTIDFIRAKALFAIDISGSLPILPAPAVPGQEDPGLFFTWHKAVHPLLYLSHRRQNREVVPLDIGLNREQRILVISGPNAGGKSVCLKTAGLVQYMFQCGLLPPMRADSEMCIFSKLFIDIGDEQSIDNDLSTYSSKLINLKFFIENVDARSLFLMDELGTGTDPSLGGAIAEATLEKLNSAQGMGIVTTHYSNLKLLAGREPGIVNGAMLFDLKKLKPLYQLKTGKPGSSFAMEMAQAIGFPDDILKIARSKTGRSQLDFDRELQNLEVEKQEINSKYTEIKVADEFLAELISKYEKLTGDLESKKKEILEKARTEARRILDESNRIIERTVKEIREAQAEKSRTREVRSELQEKKSELLGEEKSMEKLAGTEPVKNQKKTILVLPGNTEKNPYQSYINELNAKLTGFSLTLDLRGKRVDEAHSLLQRYIDDAILLSIHEVQILHGKGNGVLRQVTRDYLRSQKEVKSCHDAPLEQGGAGITVVVLR